MIILKNCNAALRSLVLAGALFSAISCSTGLKNNRIEGKKIPITQELPVKQEIEEFVKPYRDHIDKDLATVLAYSPEALDKSKSIQKWQTPIGNLMADITFEAADKLFMQRHQKHVDVCLLNHGGIRATIPQGDVTTRTAFEVMPFENSLIIVSLKGRQIKEIAEYFAKEKKPHPLAGMSIVMNADGTVKDIKVQGRKVGDDNIYNVATSDYLSNGGDNMEFFKKGVASYDMDYKLRNIIIDYFKAVDTINASKTLRVITE